MNEKFDIIITIGFQSTFYNNFTLSYFTKCFLSENKFIFLLNNNIVLYNFQKSFYFKYIIINEYK